MNAPDATGAVAVQHPSLGAFQDAFAAALRGVRPADAAVARLAALPAFAVYRNTAAKACVDALAANFSTVRRLVGEDWFRAAAGAHAHAVLPVDARLLRYGHDFPQFLAAFPPAAELPYLPGVAELDQLWIECHAAADEPLLVPDAMAAVPREALAEAVVRPHAAARWRWFDGEPVGAIWRANRDGTETTVERLGHGDGTLLTRLDGGVGWQALDAGGCAFLSACAEGETLAESAARALACGTEDLPALLAGLVRAGAFTCISTSSRSTP